MKKKPLIETNPYLKNPAMRRFLVARSVATSGGVEGIKPSSSAASHHIAILKPSKLTPPTSE